MSLRFVLLRSKLVVFLVTAISILSFSASFYFSTRDGMGISGSFDSINYLLGFPYSEVGFKLPLDETNTIFLSAFGGYDFIRSTYFMRLSPDFNVEKISVSIPLELSTRIVQTDEATETGRFNIGIATSIRFENIDFAISAYYSAFYLFYDPAFSVNIPTVYTDDIFRSALNIKISYIQPSFSISFGYFASLRWLSYRASFITGENSAYVEAKLKIRF
ncbi:hypothetical protein [Fervidobacterium islandicum]|uniref:hypothetical protein n=1 Tax=Fervidobacterium islandicum TaxID=2423 RepID=UPI003A7969AE